MYRNVVVPWGLKNWGYLAIIVVSLLLLAGCGTDEGNTTVSPNEEEASTLTPTSLEHPGATGKPTPGSTPLPEPSITDPIILKLLAPQHGAGVEVGAVRVMGLTSGTGVKVNGASVPVADNGSFQRDIPLAEGLNMIEVVASVPWGQTASQQLGVFSISSIAGLPLSLFYPPDGLTVTEPVVTVLGVTAPDAIVGVNDIPVDPNALGIFSSTVDLEEGPNLVQVVATDIVGNIRFQTVAIFYTP